MDSNLRTLYVENFPLNTTEATLTRLFANFGKITQLNLPKFDPNHPLCRGLPKPLSKGYAFVEFDSREEANAANTLFNDLNFILDSSHYCQSTSYLRDSDSQELAQKLRKNLEFKQLLHMRVMFKKRFQELTDRYNEQKLKSLVAAARLLYLAPANN